jgi:hypothetical protein
LLPAEDAYTGITFTDTLTYYYPAGNQELRYILADMYIDDTCSERAGQSLAFRINSCTYFDTLGLFYTISYTGWNLEVYFVMMVMMIVVIAGNVNVG